MNVAIFLANGFEEIEALTVVDLMRRAGICIDMVSVTNDSYVTGSHLIETRTDYVLREVNFDAYDMLVLPGGLVGTQGLEHCEGLMQEVDRFDQQGKYIAAICAAPGILGRRGILQGRNACCYPTEETHLHGAVITKGPVEVSDHIITARGMGASIDFALKLIELLEDKKCADTIAQKIVYREN